MHVLMKRTSNVLQLVETKAFLACPTIDEWIVKGLLVTGVFPNQPVLNYRRIDAFDIVALVYEPSPPALFYVIGQLDTERAIVPG